MVPLLYLATGQIYLGYNFWRYRKTLAFNPQKRTGLDLSSAFCEILL